MGVDDIRRIGYGESESMISVVVGSREEIDTEDMTNLQHYSFWLEDIQPGDRIVQSFDYCGQTYRVVIENWTYSFKGGDTMNEILSPYQETLDYDPKDLPLAKSLYFIHPL
jgi:hypothetical protein